MSLSHVARGAIAAENSRPLMMLRGFTPNGHRLWDRFEAGNLFRGYAGALTHLEGGNLPRSSWRKLKLRTQWFQR